MIDKELVKSREANLQSALTQLKADFVGLDDIIDQIGDRIHSWAVYPEILRRPTIICLWGMTGVGKSDLVRKLTSYLHPDGYLELQMADSTDSSSKVMYALNESVVRPGSQSVIFFDEMQRFRSKDEHGALLRDQSYSDLWELLSDGKITVSEDDLRESILAVRASLPDPFGEWEPEDEEDKEPPQLNVWTRNRVATLLGKKVKDVPKRATPELLLQLMELPSVMQHDYRKCLIILGGNLDSAYNHIPDNVTANWMMADWNHRRSLEVGVLEVKEALREKFTPEQVARFGNSHIIYPALRLQDFKEVVNREISRWQTSLREIVGMDTIVSQDVHDLILRNGCYPTQGVRPLFSTAQEILEGTVAPAVVRYLGGEGTTCVSVGCDASGLLLTAAGLEPVRIPYVGDMDQAYASISKKADMRRVISVHEAGHAVVTYYALGVVPELMLMMPTGGGSTFFSFDGVQTPNTELGHIAVGYGGWCAETMMLSSHTMGAARDFRDVTERATGVVRSTGFLWDNELSSFPPMAAAGSPSSDDIDDLPILRTSQDEAELVKSLCRRGCLAAQAIVSEHRGQVEKLSELFHDKMCLTKDEIEAVLLS